VTKSILVVDDEQANRDLLEAVLAEEGYRVRLADSGVKALATAVGELPDLIRLDLMMPGMSGFEVCRQLRADPTTQAIPIIVITALGQLKSKEALLTEGADDYVTKPIQIDDMRARVAALLAVRDIDEQPARTLAYLRALEGTAAARVHPAAACGKVPDAVSQLPWRQVSAERSRSPW